MNGKKNLGIEEMIEELEEYYNLAGIENYYENVLKGKTEAAIRKIYEETFEDVLE